MISIVQPLHIGNALRLFIEPPAGALRWRVLRKGSDAFAGHDDPSALVAYEGDDKVVLDFTALPNEVMAFYRPFYTADGVTWSAGPTSSGTPRATYEEFTTDVMALLRDRLEAGLKVEVERGNLINELGYVQVYTAPPSLERDLRFPLVTMSLENEASGYRGIGENISGDEFDSIGFEWGESEGWLENVTIKIVGWSLNSDERLELRKAIRRIIIANLQVFGDAGMDQVDLSASDDDAVNGEYAAPIYLVNATLSCVAPVRVGGDVSAIVDATATFIQP